MHLSSRFHVCCKSATCTHGHGKGGSKQVHVISHTPAYSLGGVVFSPNDAFSANTQQRWTGLVFANAVHTTVGLPHLTGEKWALIDQEVSDSWPSPEI